MSPPPRLWLLRHAQPLIAPGVCYGQLDVAADAALTLSAAQAFATTLRDPLSASVGQQSPIPLRHSPLQRCEQLMLALTVQTPDLVWNVQADPRIQEMHFGQWEGVAWCDIPAADIDAWAQQLHLHAPGGGESLASMLKRVQSALRESWQHDSQGGQRDVVWITHAGVIRCVQWLVQHGQQPPSSSEWNLPAPACGGWTSWEWSRIQQGCAALT